MRVIAGTARGRPLRAPTNATTRPTADKIKGTMFSMLEAEAFRRGFASEPGDEERDGRFAAAVAWPRVLELFAGSGALAIEALSRGALHADLVEPNASARRAITANLEKTGLSERATTHALSSGSAVSTFAGPYDLILLDPPYDAEGIPQLLEQIANGTLLDRSGVVVWEHPRTQAAPDWIGQGESGLQRLKTNAHGGAAVSLYGAAAAE
ncbi:MAG: RsmD family RNA methyltransferase [Chloroflexi bacterium]|nr:RsmD family RNA methyltransferase [Chloroflexota bacterium]